MKFLASICSLLLLVVQLEAQVKPLPKLKVAPNGRYFVTQSGQPFWWLGDTGWLLFIKTTREEAVQYLEQRKQQGFNVVQVMVLHDVRKAVNVYGDSAIVNRDVARPAITKGNNPNDPAQYDFWDHVDYIIDQAAQRGIYMALVPVWGTNVKSGWVTESSARTYAQFLANRYKNKSNIIWLNGGDIPGSDSLPTWNQIGRTIRSIDKNHLMTFHPRGRTTSSRWFHNESWLDFNMFQSGHRNYAQDTSKGETHYGEDNWKYIQEDWKLQPVKPTMDGEPSYEGIPEGLHDTTERFWNDADVRRYAYWNTLSGGAGYTYGHSAVMQFYRAKDEDRAYGAKVYWQPAMHAPGAEQMKYVSQLVRSKPFQEGVPDQSMIIDNGQRYERVVAFRGAAYAWLYTYTGKPFTVAMGMIPGDVVKASWFNPRNGSTETIGLVANKGYQHFDAPGATQPGNDWVLVLESSTTTPTTAYLFSSFHEPATDGLRLLYSYDGYHWNDVNKTFLTPAVGNQRVMRDPSIAQGPDGTFHLVWTSSWRGDKGFGYASSKDLIHWSEQRLLPVMEHEKEVVNVWAPEIFYDEETKQFIIIWASAIPGRFERGIEDDNNNHRMYVTTTADFKTFTPTKLFLDPGFSVIDATIVRRGSQDYVLVLKDNTRPNRNIKVAYGKTALGPYTGVTAAFTDNFTEGPSVVKTGNDWLVYFDAYREKKYGAVKTSNFQTFTRLDTAIGVPEGHKHGTIFSVSTDILTGLLNQDTVHYTGKTLVNVDYHDGRLPLAMGVHNVQVVRAHRDLKDAAHSFGWTYNHAPMLAYWNNTFYLEYLSNPVGEHVPPGQTLLVQSKDGYDWGEPVVLFPPYKVPDGFKKADRPGVASNLVAVMHQRMGFYAAANKKLLALAYYGIAMDSKDDPNDGNGVGRVVREIKADGSFGPIYFIRYNHDFNEKNSNFPFYKSSKDVAFVAACEELLSKPLMMQQWNEEADRDDPLIPVKKEYKAFNFYHLPDGRTVGLWKHALTSISTDEGKSWLYNPMRAPGFVNSNAKIWGQRTTDGRYLTVYNPSEFRWPLALSISEDGLNYQNLLLVNGEITPMRYGGNYKSYGPQYVRGIQEGDGIPPDGKAWVSYSMNKEDIWVASIPVPVTNKAVGPIEEDFSKLPAATALQYWNTYSPVWAPVNIIDGALVLKDKDAHDYAKAERLLPAAGNMHLEFSVTPAQADHGQLDIELTDSVGAAGVRFTFGPDSQLVSKSGARYKTLLKYEAGTTYHIKVDINTAARMYTMNINGKAYGAQILFAPLPAVERIVLRTGGVRTFPTPDTPADNFADLPDAGKQIKEAVYSVGYLKVKTQ
ncbi:DUF4038 domain-containing protein [Paraflavitalea pollutisoli]|uniref:apiosidase-like domain-containing protein n=1 Tax=Paraflavitalea pollutisoli TaxID=3034143 RepID=UPI0023EAA08E|nr:DUF4038 domain-containing protein [Paraflavitalea sp. H1-2-19X]